MYSNDNVEYARQRLNGTIITHMGKAVEVVDVIKKRGNKPLQIVSMEVISGRPIDDTIDGYDLTPAKLGFVNSGGNLAYIARKPLRNDWRQGLRAQQVVVPFATKNFILKMQDVARTIENIFPTIDEIRDEFNGKKNGMRAWCRDFCVDDVDNIHYRTFGKVGNFIKDTKEFLLDAKFFWVEERLKEVV
jgi:hypothetical protein